LHRYATQKFGRVSTSRLGGSNQALLRNVNSLHSFTSHIEEFKALEEYVQTVLDLKQEANALFEQGHFEEAA